jgi:hypothetical protein
MMASAGGVPRTSVPMCTAFGEPTGMLSAGGTVVYEEVVELFGDPGALDDRGARSTRPRQPVRRVRVCRMYACPGVAANCRISTSSIHLVDVAIRQSLPAPCRRAGNPRFTE